MSQDKSAQRRDTTNRDNIPGYEETPEPQAEPGALRWLTPDELETVELNLMELQFTADGLNRDQIRKKYRGLPEEIYLRLPSSRRFLSAKEVLREAAEAQSRSEGDFLGPNPDIPEKESVEDGGPPSWGGTPLFTIDAVEDGGSAEDKLELDSNEPTTR